MKKPQSMTVSNEAYTEIQIFRIGRFVAVALKYVATDQGGNIADLGI